MEKGTLLRYTGKGFFGFDRRFVYMSFVAQEGHLPSNRYVVEYITDHWYKSTMLISADDVNPVAGIYMVSRVWADQGCPEYGPPAVVQVETLDMEFHESRKAAVKAAWELGVHERTAELGTGPLGEDPVVKRSDLLTHYCQTVEARIPTGVQITYYSGKAATDKVHEFLQPCDDDGLPF